ncbi:DUF927 domain-containing protein [Rhodobacter capsulatus]|uniref:DUF927 domain-containing protein n=1 Tax=Rhodobacter capsulatus TaxID=1061 RepID=UPI0004246581|nr:DUF927 domain-containing protein [Rhodobacter capsulatus]
MNALNVIDAKALDADTEHDAQDLASLPAPAPQFDTFAPIDDIPPFDFQNEIDADRVETSPRSDDSASEITIDETPEPITQVPALLENETTSKRSKSPVSIPDGYALFDDGIYEMKTEDAEPVFICSPLRVDAMFGDRDGRGWGRLVCLRDDDGRWHEVPVLNADLARHPGEVLARLLDHGLMLGCDKTAKQSLTKLLTLWKPEARLTSVSRLGWTDAQFRASCSGMR